MPPPAIAPDQLPHSRLLVGRETVVFGETLFSAVLGLLLAGARIVRYKTTLDEAQAADWSVAPR